MATLAYDLETFRNLFTAAFEDVETGEKTFFVIYDGWSKEDNDQKWRELREFVCQPDLTLAGFNSYRFDNLLLARILDVHSKRPLTCEGLWNLAQIIITRDRESWSPKLWQAMKRLMNWKFKFQTIDLQEIIAVNMNRPALKNCAIHLKHHKLQDLPLPYNESVKEEDIPFIVKYNFNDVGITCKLFHALKDEIEMREELGKEYGVDLLAAGDSAITNIIFTKEYGEPDEKGTFRNQIFGHEVLPRHYNFVTPEMQTLIAGFYDFDIVRGKIGFQKNLADQMVNNNSLVGICEERAAAKKKKTYSFRLENGVLELQLPAANKQVWETTKATQDRSARLFAYILIDHAAARTIKFANGNKLTWGEKSFTYEFAFCGATYSFGVGGMHSKDEGGVFRSQPGLKIIDADVSSYYPRLRQNENFYPAHLELDRIKQLDIKLTNNRLEAKKQGKKAKSEGLKISVNGAFGKMNYSGFWLYDPLCFYQTTIGGQIYLLDLIEKLALEGIRCISANTDGIVCLVPDDKQETYQRLCQEWQQKTSLELEFTEYDLYVRRDVNAYLARSTSGKVKTKNVFSYDDSLTVWTFRKGFKYPIVSMALRQYFLDGTPIEKTVGQHEDVHDFMMTERSNAKFVQFFQTVTETIPLQKTNRFIATTKGGIIYKQAGPRRTSLLSGRTVMVLNDVESAAAQDYPLDYTFYIQEAYKILDKIEPKQMSLF